MKYLSLLVLFFSINAFAYNVGFESGHEMTTVLSQGNVRVFCNGARGQTSAYLHCYSNDLTPSLRSKLMVTDGVINADKVKLTAFHADGSQRSKSSKFDSNEGKSTKSFNLWISTVFQRPLLESGLNRIVYQFMNEDEVVADGEFEVVINRGEDRNCSYGTIFSHRDSDCRAGSNICNAYFRRYCD